MILMTKKSKIYFSDIGVLLSILMGAIGIYYLVLNFSMLAILLYIFGWTIYLIQENLIHNYVFHFPKFKNKFLYLLQYRIHVGHHDQPYNSKILFTPFWFSIGTVLINVSILILLGVKLEFALITILGGGVHAYLVFEWVHLSCHSQDDKKSKLIKSISKYHNRHHFLNYNYWFSISPGSRIIDKIFGTGVDHKSIEQPEYVKSVGVSDDDEGLIYARSIFKFSDDLKELK